MLKRFINFSKRNKPFILIVVLAAIVRFAAITNVPPSLNWDEVSHGYNAYSILKTGKDEWGNYFPVIFRAYGDYKLPVYIYATTLSLTLFGLNAFAVRLPSILAGIITVVFTYLLVNELFGYKSVGIGSEKNSSKRKSQERSTALIASLLVAFEPWSLFLSRAAFEANLALALFVSAFFFFLKGLRAPKFLFPAVISFGLTVWTYNSYRIFTPLFVGIAGFIYRGELLKIFATNKKIITYYLLLTAFFFLPMFWQLANSSGQARYGKVTIIIARINELRNSSKLPGHFPRLIHNKLTFFTLRYLKNWVSHFGGDFLFFKGGSHYQFNVPNHGLLYPYNIIFLISGVLLLMKKRSKETNLILMWFYLGFVASSLTREAPHALRSVTVLPTPMIISSYAVTFLIGWLRGKLRKLFLIGFIAVFIFSAVNYLFAYSNSYRRDYSWSWQYGYREVVDYIKKNYIGYDKIIITKKYGEPHEFILFYWSWNPESYRNDANLNRFYQSNWYWVDGFDKFYFVNDWQIPHSYDEDFVLESGNLVTCHLSLVTCLLITSPGNYPEGWNKLEIVNFLDGKPAFEIYDNK